MFLEIRFTLADVGDPGRSDAKQMIDYFSSRLNPTATIEMQSQAAVFLRAEGLSGLPYLEPLLSRRREVDLSREDLTNAQVNLTGLGALSMGTIRGLVPFNQEERLHTAIANWICDGTNAKSLDVSGYCICALGEIGSRFNPIIEKLGNIVVSPLRQKENATITERACALRMLNRLDQSTIHAFKTTDAWKELCKTFEIWLANEPRDR